MLIATSLHFLTHTSYYHLQPCLTRKSVLRSSKLGVIYTSLSRSQLPAAAGSVCLSILLQNWLFCLGSMLRALHGKKFSLKHWGQAPPWESKSFRQIPVDSLLLYVLPCSRLEEQNVKTSLNVRPRMKLVSPGVSIFHGARSSRYRTRCWRNVLPFPVRAVCKSFASPRDHRAPSSSWEIRDLRILPNGPVNSCPATSGCDLPAFQVTTTRIEERSEILGE